MDTILFDLDGTLLPMDQDAFIEGYFKGVSKKLYPYDFDTKTLVSAIWEGTKSMIENDGSMRNDQRFWNTTIDILGQRIMDHEHVFSDYYKSEFQDMKKATNPNPLAKKIIDKLKDKGYRVILATNPVFPKIATYSRISWAGLEPNDFELITTYENSSFCKPNVDYYKEILNKQELKPSHCLMVGNDISDDMVCKTLGMDVYLVTDCLINNHGEDINKYRNGTLSDLYDYIRDLPSIKSF